MIHDNINIEKSAENIHNKMSKILKLSEWKFYELVYIQFKTEEEAARIIGYKTTEKNRLAGYKQIKNLKKSIIKKVKKYIYSGEIDIR